MKNLERRIDPISREDDFPVNIFFYTLPRKKIESLHLHDCLELGFCREGRGVFLVEEKVMPFQEGDLCVVGKTEFHKARSYGEPPANWLFLQFDPEILLCGEKEENRYLSTDRLRGRRYPNITTPSPELRGLFRILEKECAERNPDRQAMIKSLLRAVMILLNRNAPENTEPETPGAKRLAPALRLMTDLSRNAAISELSKSCAMSPSVFLRTFRAVFRISPGQYKIHYRMRIGAYLMKHEDKGVMEAAEAVGYESVSTFHRHFKSFYGVSPLQYKKKPEEIP